MNFSKEGLKEQLSLLDDKTLQTFYYASLERESQRLANKKKQSIDDIIIVVDLELLRGVKDPYSDTSFYTEGLSFFRLISHEFGSMVKSMLPNMDEVQIEDTCRRIFIKMLADKKVLSFEYHYNYQGSDKGLFKINKLKEGSNTSLEEVSGNKALNYALGKDSLLLLMDAFG